MNCPECKRDADKFTGTCKTCGQILGERGKCKVITRHSKTIEFMLKHIPIKSTILDLGNHNVLGQLLKEEGYRVRNTDFDLDVYPKRLREIKADVCTGFEILEHLIEPARVLRNIRANEIVISVPMKRVLEKTYWNPDDEYDQHYHEFEMFQFDKLLKHCNYEIICSEKWKSYSSVLGRIFYQQPKFYIVHAQKGESNEV